MGTVWTTANEMPQFERLENDLHTNVLVIGGGMAGVLCVYMLAQVGVDCALIEANRIGSGVTSRTTAKLTSQHGLIYDSLSDRYTAQAAKQYWLANEEAISWYRQMSERIPCDFEEKDAYVFSTDSRDRLEYEWMALRKLGIAADFVKDVPLPLDTVGALRFSRQAQFHPMKFLAGIVKGLPIYERTKAVSFDGERIHTECAVITAKTVIVATHFPMFNKHGGYFLKLYQHRSYVLALENAADVNGMYVDEKQTGLSFRNEGSRLLVGGGAHRTGKRGGGFDELKTFAAEAYPNSEIVEMWATQDCMSLDGVPYIGVYSRNTPHLLVATGFNKWGMTTSFAAAKLLCHLVKGENDPTARLFSPQRSVWHTQLAANLFESLLHMVKPTVPRCPHMGCALMWNKDERSWDCPCHGSRFSENGTLRNGPATDDLKR